MSWAFLHHRHSTSYVLDMEEYNDNIAAFSAEIDGNLNEQNSQPLILEDVIANGSADPALGLRIASNKQPRDPHDFVATGFEVPQTEQWHHVGGTRLTFTSRGGKCLVIYSFQCHMSTGTLQTGLNFCIEVDGAARAASLLGTGDQGNDFIDGGQLVLDPGTVVVEFDYGTSPSFRAVQTPHLVSLVLELEPGEHEFWLVARNLGNVADAEQWITNCEGIALDGWC